MMKINIPCRALAVLAAGLLAVAPPALARETNGVATDVASPATTNTISRARPVKPGKHHVKFELGNTRIQFDAKETDAVRVGQDFELHGGETTNNVVVVFGNTRVGGTVAGDLVTVFGSTELRSNAVVRGSMVTVAGSATVASNAVVRSDLVVVGGRLNAPPDFKPGGNAVVIGWPQWLEDWLHTGFLRGVLLPSWLVAGLFLLLNVLLSLLFPRPLQRCTDTVHEKPLQSFLLGLLLMMAAGPICLLLLVSCVGIPVIPFLLFAALAALVFGVIAVYRSVGHQVGRLTGLRALEHPLLALLVGTVILHLAYMLPVAGFILWGLVVVLGFGAAWLAVFTRARRESSPTVPPTAPISSAPPVVTDTATSAAPATSAPQPLDVAPLPRAGFWIRLAATLIDVVLISILLSMLGMDGFFGHAEPAVILRHDAARIVHLHSGVFSNAWPALIFLVYLAGLWAWRGTTIGGIIFGLKAVRLNGQPLNWAVAIVRVLASLLSLAVMGLGFFWIAWDREKQAWHDKIAGTLVVRMPKGVSLI